MGMIIAAMIVGFGTLAAIGYLVFYKFMSVPPHLTPSRAPELRAAEHDQT